MREKETIGQPRTVEQKTGIKDANYDLVSILYHALQGAETCETYIRDAEQAGDPEVAQFFRDVQTEERNRATRCQQLLGSRLAAQR